MKFVLLIRSLVHMYNLIKIYYEFCIFFTAVNTFKDVYRITFCDCFCGMWEVFMIYCFVGYQWKSSIYNYCYATFLFIFSDALQISWDGPDNNCLWLANHLITNSISFPQATNRFSGIYFASSNIKWFWLLKCHF